MSAHHLDRWKAACVHDEHGMLLSHEPATKFRLPLEGRDLKTDRLHFCTRDDTIRALQLPVLVLELAASLRPETGMGEVLGAAMDT